MQDIDAIEVFAGDARLSAALRMRLLKVVSVVTLDKCFSIIMSFAVLLSLFQNMWVLDRSDVCNDQVDVRYAKKSMDMLSPAGFVCQAYLFVMFL